MAKSAILRAAITPAEHEKIRIDAIRAGVPVQTYVAALLRAGIAAFKDGAGKGAR